MTEPAWQRINRLFEAHGMGLPPTRLRDQLVVHLLAHDAAIASDTPAQHSDGGFTPGPWEWACGLVPPDGPERYADIYKDGGDLIIAQFNDLIPEGKANARLIAAAPRLLAALVGLYERYIQAIGNEGPEAAEARCAISEAEGR